MTDLHVAGVPCDQSPECQHDTVPSGEVNEYIGVVVISDHAQLPKTSGRDIALLGLEINYGGAMGPKRMTPSSTSLRRVS